MRKSILLKYPQRCRVPGALGALLAGILVATVSIAPASPAAGRARASRSAPKVRLAEATTVTRSVTIGSTGPRQAELGAAALARLRINYADMFPGWTIAFLPSRSNLLGMTLTKERRVEIYVRGDRSVEALTHDLAHELGHVTDVLYNTEERRQHYLELRGLPGSTPWWTCNECRDMQVGAGDFAETFALLAAPPFRFYSELGKRSDAAALQRIADEILPQGLLVATR